MFLKPLHSLGCSLFFWICVIVNARCQVYVLENRYVAWRENWRLRKPNSVRKILEIKMRDYFEVVLCLALFPLLYLQTWGCLLIDESLQTGLHSERQLEQPRCFTPGLMGHVYMQQRGSASSSCPHIWWINEEILPKTRTLTDNHSGQERYVCMDVCDHTSSGVCTHTQVFPAGRKGNFWVLWRVCCGCA